jgi:hypothetical protein
MKHYSNHPPALPGDGYSGVPGRALGAGEGVLLSWGMAVRRRIGSPPCQRTFDAIPVRSSPIPSEVLLWTRRHTWPNDWYMFSIMVRSSSI